MSDDAPPGVTIRAPAEEDLHAVLDVVVACDIAEYGVPDHTSADGRDAWRALSLDDDARVAMVSDRIVGYAQVALRDGLRFRSDVYVHPDFHGLGIGSALTRWTEQRALAQLHRAREGARVRLGTRISARNHAAARLLERAGYSVVRHFLRMSMEMDYPPPQPLWPPGVSVRTMSPGRDERQVYEATDEAFQDHWDHAPSTFEAWRERAVSGSRFDPGLWFLAEDGDQIAGVCLCEMRDDMGLIGTVGVRRPWRRKGVAMALLHQAFGAFHSRGRRRVELGVDADSLTGAVGVYERAGMHEAHREAIYEKLLRDGAEVALR